MDLVRDSISKYQTGGRVGASGSIEYSDASMYWDLYPTSNKDVGILIGQGVQGRDVGNIQLSKV
jgi:hypothetical protein